MPIASLMADIGLSTPLTTAQRPFILWVGGTDLIGYADISSYSLDDKDLTQPGILTVTFTDANNAVGQYIHRLDEVMWVQTNPDRILYRGFVRQIDMTPVATYGLWTITCADISEMLDYAYPVVSDTRPNEELNTTVQNLLGNYGTASSMGTGGYINGIPGAFLNLAPLQRETLRTALEKSLAAATNQWNSSVSFHYYLDYYYQFHAFNGLGDMAAPYGLTDTNPDPSGHLGPATVSYSNLTATQDATADTDNMFVYGTSSPPPRILGDTGGTIGPPAFSGSGIVSAGIPRWPVRYSTIDATTANSPTTMGQAGQAQLLLVQNINRVQVTVTGYDGWTKGQTVYVTNVQMGWSAVRFWIVGVSMRTLSPTGYREYTLQLNASLPRMSRILAAANNNGGPILGAAIQGQIGGY